MEKSIKTLTKRWVKAPKREAKHHENQNKQINFTQHFLKMIKMIKALLGSVNFEPPHFHPFSRPT